MPGKPNGNVSQVYAWRIINKIVKEFDYLVDLHTASNGRVNSYYIRADMDDPTTRQMALLQNAQIIGKRVSPVNQTGGRIVHLGILA